MAKTYTLSDFITDLQAIERGYGNIPVLNGRMIDLSPRQITIEKIDDWSNSTKTEDGEIPGIGHAVSIGPRF